MVNLPGGGERESFWVERGSVLRTLGHIGRLRLTWNKKRFSRAWFNSDDALDQSLGRIARSAADRLTSPHCMKHVRQCESDRRRWLLDFLPARKSIEP